MHTSADDFEIEQRVATRTALSDISYAAQTVMRWAIKAEALMPGPSDGVQAYIELLNEDIDRLVQSHVRLLRVRNAAFVQHVSHETNKEAA